MRLNRNHLICRRAGGPIDVRVELVQRLAADAAVAAVLEEQDRTISRFGDGGLQLVKVGYDG